MNEDYNRVATAIHYLTENFDQQPSLDQVAAQVHLSPYHFQRLFQRWAGISPKRFVQFLTLEYAQHLLRQSRSVLETTYAAGLSSPSRLHDLFVSFEAVTPAQYRTMGRGLTIAYGFHPSPFGECLIATTERGLCGLSFVDADAGRTGAFADFAKRWPNAELNELPQRTKPLAAKIFTRPHDGQKPSLKLFLKGTQFQLKVWQALLDIPEGCVATYGDLARHIAQPTAARAVGNAVGANPIAYLIPCHRIIRQSGAFGHYQWGGVRKKALLAWEAGHNRE